MKAANTFMKRPDFASIKTASEFNSWYWLKKEMVEICKTMGLPSHGRKFDLRDRIMYALNHNGKILHSPEAKKVKSTFNWAKSKLRTSTLITDNISFGPNFRNFMKSNITGKFSCTAEFMSWVRSNEGKTLGDAIAAFYTLEKRKENPDFKREIAKNNMFNQYTRDYLTDNPEHSLNQVRKCWLLKKQLPANNGFVVYERCDLELL